MSMDWAQYVPELKLLAIATVLTLTLFLIAPLITRLIARIARPSSFTRELIEHVKPPINLLIPLLGLRTFLASADDAFHFIDTARHLNSLAILAALTWLGLRIIATGQDIIIKRHPINITDNLHARRIQTQTKVLVQTLSFFVILFGIAAMLMTFPNARQFGTSILASAGLAGLAVGFAAKPVLGNLIAGLQIAITQPISLDDVVIVEGEWGRVEEITSTYVVVRIWDARRLIVPLQYFIETPFQNWTRTTSDLIGSVYLWMDYSTPLEPLRKELKRLCQQSPDLWDGKTCVLQVTDVTDKVMQIRILVSTKDSSKGWDLRCFVREKMINYVAVNYPQSLPKLRANVQQEIAAADVEDNSSDIPEHQPSV